MKLSFAEKYAVLGTRELAYEGMFITGVKTTGIFCRPSCRARRPLAKNVEFFGSAQEALQSGYRPCKICKPMEAEGTAPQYIQNLIKDMHAEPFRRIKDCHLRDMHLDPNTVRRWFKANHGLTFQAYQRLIRLNSAFRQIKAGRAVAAAAFDNGFNSLSGFNDGYKKIFGDSPSNSADKTVIRIERFSSVLGPLFICATDEGICLLEFTDRRMLESEFADLRKRLNAVIVPGMNSHISEAKKQVHAYLGAELREFSLALHTPGTDFQKSVWALLQTIPYGETHSYLQQAKGLGNPKAVRAVARANGMNRIAMVIPCHRVLGSDGSLTGYAGGLPRKKWLLDMEAGQGSLIPAPTNRDARAS